MLSWWPEGPDGQHALLAPAPSALRSVVRDSGRRARRGHAAHCHRGPRRRSRHGSRGPAAGCSGRGRGAAEHLHLQPRRPPRRLPGSYRPPAVHAQDQSSGWRAARSYSQMFVADPSCCPSRSSLMTGRYPHNNGVHNQQEGTAVRRRALDGLLPAYRRLRDVPRRQVPHHLAQDDAAAVLRPLDGDVGWLQQRPGEDRRDVEEEHRLLDDVPRARRVASYITSALSGSNRSSSTRPRRRRTGWTSPIERHHDAARRPGHRSTRLRTSGRAPASRRQTGRTSRPMCAR